MSTSIQRFPTGLLELIGAKANGVNPAVLEQAVRPTLDIKEFFGQPEDLSATGTLAEGAGVSSIVPAGQFWLLRAASLSVVFTSTVSVIQGAIYLGTDLATPVGAPALCFGMPTAGLSTACPRLTLCCFVPPSPIVLPPGSVLQGVIELLGTDLTADATLRLRISRLT